MVYETGSAEETKEFARQMGRNAKKGDIYCLSGDLGVGKTVFAQGFAQGLDIDGYVTSPTFTIMNEYQGRLPLYHFDIYRITSLEEMDDTGYEEYFFGKGICLVEWAEQAKELIPEDACWITLEKDYGKNEEDYRRITIKKGGE